MRVTAALFIAFIFSLNPAQASLTECQKILIGKSLTSIRAEAPFVKRLVLKVMNHSLENRVLAACEGRGLCGEREIAAAVRENVEALSGELKLARGYAIILGAWAGGLGLSSYLNTIPTAHSYAPVTALITGVGLSWISAPIMDRLSSKVRRGVYALLGLETKQGDARGTADSELEQFYVGTQATIGPLAQIGGQRLNQFLDSLDKKMSDARESLAGENESLAVDQLAEIAVRMRELFPDVAPDQKAVARVVRTTFSRHVNADREALSRLVRARIDELDEHASQPRVRDYYDRVLLAWLR